MIIDNIPTYIYVSKNKKVALNMNTYRNLHFQANNKAKHNLMVAIKMNGDFNGELPQPPYQFVYTIFRKDRKRADLMNIGSVVDKFLSDALVTLGYIADDNTDIIKKVTVIDGGIDKQNPHAKLEILSL
jgi:hypothetical protein